jgi:hypothetical protein
VKNGVRIALVLVLGAAWRYVAPDAPPPTANALEPAPANQSTSRSKATPRSEAARPPPAVVAELHVARAPERRAAEPAAVEHALEQGHGSELWRRSDDAERLDFEPRYALDAGFAELGGTPPGAFH